MTNDANARPPPTSTSPNVIHSIRSYVLSPMDTASLVLMAIGHKPASEIELTSTADADALGEAIRYLGFAVSVTHLHNANAIFRASFDPAVIRSLGTPSPEQDIIRGRAFGIPETAIDGYIKRDFHTGTLWLDADMSPFKFRYSRLHFLQEIDVIDHWHKALEAAAPGLLLESFQYDHSDAATAKSQLHH